MAGKSRHGEDFAIGPRAQLRENVIGGIRQEVNRAIAVQEVRASGVETPPVGAIDVGGAIGLRWRLQADVGGDVAQVDRERCVTGPQDAIPIPRAGPERRWPPALYEVPG
jgi:hypothetical protein